MLFGHNSFSETAFSEVFYSNQFVVTGNEVTSEIGNVTVGLGTIAVITGEEINTFVNNVEINTDQILDITGEEIQSALSNITVRGSTLNSITGQELTASANTISILGEASITVNGNQADVDANTIIAAASADVSLSGESATATVNTFTVSAGGAIVINTPTFEANVEVSDVTVGTANFVQITGNEIDSFINNVTLSLGQTLNITGQELTAVTASENQAPTFTALANAQISTDQSKFGGSSLELDGTGDRIQSTDITLGTDSYTFETFAYYNNFSSTQCLWDGGENVGASQNPVVYITPTNLQLSYAGGTYINAAHGMSINTWHHIAIVRDGTTLSAYIDGTRIGTATYALGSGATNHIIGGNYAGTFTTNGYLDETRLTNRVIYTGASFTVPTAPFDVGTNDIWLLHYDGADGSTDIVNSVEPSTSTFVSGRAGVLPTGVTTSTLVNDFVLSTNNFLNMTGNEINTDITSLKFWDNIFAGSNVENWSNISSNTTVENWSNIASNASNQTWTNI